MIIIFGWEKDVKEITTFAQCYCYNCDDVKRWRLNVETEWVTFFAIKTIPFLIKRKVHCEHCGDIFDVSKRHYTIIKNKPMLFSDYIEYNQLTKKTEWQKAYLLERRSNTNDKQ